MAKQLIRRPAGKSPTIDTQNLSNTKQIQDYNNSAIYTKGVFANLANGTVNDLNIQLGGKARRLFGINIFFPAANVANDDIVSLTVNQEVIIDKVNWKTYSANTANNPFKTEQYFALPRGLSGSDTVLMSFVPTSAHAVWITFYLANR